MTLKRIIAKALIWLVRQGADELLKEAQRRTKPPADVRPRDDDRNG